MQPEFDLVNPESLHQALEWIQADTRRANPLAGGTNLVVDMRGGRCSPGVLVNINDLPELHSIELCGDELKIGSTVTIAELQANSLVRKYCHVLVEAANTFANPLVRNRATLGGNLVDASPAADCAPPLLVLDAEVEMVSIAGSRRVRLEDFFTGVRKTVIRRDEILVAVYVPLVPQGVITASAYYKIGLRKADAISVVSAAVLVETDAGQCCKKVRIALGSVAPLPMRAIRAEQSLEGSLLSRQAIQQAGSIAAGGVSPISDLRASAAYRRKMVEVIVCRLLRQVASQLQPQE
jgi:aerobic carbon-monoxide dehydrogenase medium subunit